MESKRVFPLFRHFVLVFFDQKHPSSTNCSRPYLRIAPCTTRKFYPTWASIWDEILFHLTRSIANSDVFHFSPSKPSLQNDLCFVFQVFFSPQPNSGNCTLLVLLVFFHQLCFCFGAFWGRKSRKLPRNIELSKKSLWALNRCHVWTVFLNFTCDSIQDGFLWVSYRSSRGP